ncbi:MAG: hypothetical protein KatS3mg010_0142 [Acidimicrobiia bacterium]|nr:MAG: hypothetical protein KatS3mg010_0142 [Acidimicrobiia bacterium]
MDVTTADLAEVVDSVMTTMLGLDLDGPTDSDGARRTTISASVQIVGAVECAVVVGCNDEFGSRVASAMFSVEPSSLSPDEVSDALGELANMIGGNVKALVGESTLSLPTVVRGDELQLAVPGASTRLGLCYGTGGSHFSVSVFERAPEGGAT